MVRTYSSNDPEEPLVEGRNIPDYWIRPHRPLLASAGLHRFVWDLHYERPAVNRFDYPMTATYQNTPRTPLGSWALPGTYTVRLTVDGVSQTQPFTVQKHPLRQISDADLDAEYEKRGLKPADPYSLVAVNEADPAFAEVLLHFGNDVQRLRNIEALARDTKSGVDGWLLSFRKFNVDSRSNDLRNTSDICHL